jgi:hypothetical protein
MSDVGLRRRRRYPAAVTLRSRSFQRTFFLASTLLLVAGPAGAQAPFEAWSAYHDGPALRFTASEEIDWASRAPAELRDLPIPTTDPAVVARFRPDMDMFGGVEIGRTVPLPEAVAAGHVYFAGAHGISSIRLDSAVVVTRLDLDPQGTTIESRRSWGEIHGTPERSPGEGGGFVLRSERPLSFRATPSTFTADDLLSRSTTIGRDPSGAYFGRGTAFWAIETQYRFSVDGDPRAWVFVQWAEDREMLEAGCQFRYEIFELDASGAATQVAWTSYGCDV